MLLKFPVIKILAAFISGIFIRKLFSVSDIYLASSFSFLIIGLITLIIFKSKQYIKDITVYLIFINFGILSFHITEITFPEYPFKDPLIKKAEVYSKVKSIDLIKQDEFRFIITTDSILTDNNSISISRNFLAHIKDDSKKKLTSFYEKLKIGNTIKLTGTISKGKERRNPGEFDYHKYLLENDISGVIYIYNVEDIQIINNKKNILANILFDIKKSIDHNLKDIYNARSSGFLRGLLLADRSDIDYETQLDFTHAGIIHILAVSGTHVAVIILIVSLFTGRLNIIFRSVLTLISVFIFFLITQGAPSVARATIMTFVLIIAFLMNRKITSGSIFNSLSIAAFIILIINPRELFSAGFQLSFSAVISIALFVPFFTKRLDEMKLQNKYIRWLLIYSSVSLAAQIGTLPFTLYYFGKLSLISLPANLIIVPFIGVVIFLGILTLIINPLLPFITEAYAAFNGFIINSIISTTKFLAGFDFSYLSIRQFSILDGIFFYLFIFFFYFGFERFKNYKFRIVLIILIVINLFTFLKLDDKYIFENNKLYVAAIDVGQGDAILIKFPNNKTALIDAGNATKNFDNGERVIIPVLNYLNIDKIDYAFISHVDSDHYAGFISLIYNNKIKRIFKPQLNKNQSKDKKLEKYLRSMRVPYSYFESKSFQIGNAKLYFLNDENINKLEGNNSSGIIKLVYGDNEFLFVGDAEIKAEKLLVEKYDDFLNADVLKVGHHGSKTSSSEIFLKEVTPEISIINAGIGNKFGHPSPIVIERLTQFKSEIYRTDYEGAIILESDGNKIKKINWREF